MKRVLTILVCMALAFVSSVANAEETGCLTAENWVIRVYSEEVASPHSFWLAVIDPETGDLIDHSKIKAFVGATTPCLNADHATTNLCEIETDALSPDVSLACDEGEGTAYITHDHAGQLSMSTIADIVRYPLKVTPTLLNFSGKISKIIVTVKNIGTTGLYISSVSLPSLPFVLGKNNCTGATLAPMTGSCTMQVGFKASIYGTYRDSFTIYSDQGNAKIRLKGLK
ncbi:MAG: hypothetical protein A2X59_07695 [Nitrospirae bacterium GWC2_42_7]|nr:MAG: hypothetical protein A2X59_07695 [Nitrospirae bacterium GWC2_42_7]